MVDNITKVGTKIIAVSLLMVDRVGTYVPEGGMLMSCTLQGRTMNTKYWVHSVVNHGVQAHLFVQTQFSIFRVNTVALPLVSLRPQISVFLAFVLS
jgi:hypothetical protein